MLKSSFLDQSMLYFDFLILALSPFKRSALRKLFIGLVCPGFDVETNVKITHKLADVSLYR